MEVVVQVGTEELDGIEELQKDKHKSEEGKCHVTMDRHGQLNSLLGLS